jgi:hypothetical protein
VVFRRLVGFAEDVPVRDVDNTFELHLDRFGRSLRHFVPPAVQLAQNGLGRDGARERPGGRAANAVGDDQYEGSGVDRDQSGRAYRRDVAGLQICNHKGVLIVMPYQADIRTPEKFCKQFGLERALNSFTRDALDPGEKR